MNISRKEFLFALGTGAAGLLVPDVRAAATARFRAKIALQIYSVRFYIGGVRDEKGNLIKKGVGFERGLEDIAGIGYKGIEFIGHYYTFRNDPKGLRKVLADVGLTPCGTHVSTEGFGLDTKKWTYNPETLKLICDFNMTYGNNLLICPGAGNLAPGATWGLGRDGYRQKASPAAEDFARRIVEKYNQVAADAAKLGCRIGIHNHMWEHGLVLANGQSFWDYFFSNTSELVCMEQDVGWTTCAGVDPAAQYAKYPHRSPTLHAKENGSGKDVTSFDGILGQPGRPSAKPVDWDALIPATEKDGVDWYVVECEHHREDFSAVNPSYQFLKSKGLS